MPLLFAFYCKQRLTTGLLRPAVLSLCCPTDSNAEQVTCRSHPVLFSPSGGIGMAMIWAASEDLRCFEWATNCFPLLRSTLYFFVLGGIWKEGGLCVLPSREEECKREAQWCEQDFGRQIENDKGRIHNYAKEFDACMGRWGWNKHLY